MNQAGASEKSMRMQNGNVNVNVNQICILHEIRI